MNPTPADTPDVASHGAAGATADRPLVRTRGLGRRYQHADGPVDALADLSLDVEAGSFVTITGPSGSGKSTLLLLLGGLLRPTSGTIHVGDAPIHALDERALAAFRRDRLGFVLQSFSLIPYLTAAQNVAVPMALRRVPREVARERAEALLASVGLEARRGHLPRELSIGQQQRVAIARAFANDPDLILADEPTGNLDPSLARDILALLDRLNAERGATVVMVTHSPEAAAHGRLRLHLEAGRLVGRDGAGARAVATA